MSGLASPTIWLMYLLALLEQLPCARDLIDGLDHCIDTLGRDIRTKATRIEYDALIAVSTTPGDAEAEGRQVGRRIFAIIVLFLVAIAHLVKLRVAKAREICFTPCSSMRNSSVPPVNSKVGPE